MADNGGRTEPDRELDRELDRWFHEEVDVRAPDRLLEDVFARTEAARQVHGGWLGRLGTLGRPHGRTELGVRLRRGLVGLTAVLVVGLVGATIGPRLGTSPGAVPASRAPTPSAGGGPSPTLVVERSHATCARRGSLFVLPDTAEVGSTAWVTCGADSDEVVLGSDTVTSRPGLGAVATDGATEWAISGDSVVELKPDRSIAQTVRIGTPSAIAVGSGVVWALDARTGSLSSIAATGVVRTVTPAPGGRPIALAIAAGSLWVLDQAAGQLLRLDLHNGRQLAAIAVAPTPTMLVSAAHVLYVASPLTGTIVRIEPAAGTAISMRPDLGPDGHIDALGGSPDGLVLGSRNDVFRLDPATAALSVGGHGPGYVDAVGLDGSTILVLIGDGTLLEAILP